MKKIAWSADEAMRLGRRVEHRRQLVHERDHADGEPGEVPLARPARSRAGSALRIATTKTATRARFSENEEMTVMRGPGRRRAGRARPRPACAARRVAGRPRMLPAGSTQRRNPWRAASRAAPRPGPPERTSPVSPTSPHRTTSSGSGRPRTLDATAATTARSAAGSSTRRPPATFRNTSWSWSCMRQPLLEHREQQRDAAGIDADGGPSGHGEPRARHERLDLHQHGTATLQRREHGRAGRARGALGEKRGRRVRHLDETALRHLEHAHLVRRAEAVLHRAQHAQRVRAVALEVEHRVDEVLEHARAGERTLLGDVADQHARRPARLAVRGEQRRRLAHLSRRSPAPTRASPCAASGSSRRRPPPDGRRRSARSPPRRWSRAGSGRPRRRDRGGRRAAGPAPATPRRRRRARRAPAARARCRPAA